MRPEPPTTLRRPLEDLEIPQGAALLIACSGGVDSVGLAAAVAWLGRWRMRLAYVDHGLHARAMGQARAVLELGRRLGYPVDCLAADPRTISGGGGVEDGARRARYACLGAAAARRGAVAVLTAHTAEDQAETLLMRLADGAGTRGLSGIPPRRGLYLRPWLGVHKAQIRTFVAAAGLPVVEDPTNADERLSRNRLRGALPRLTQALGPHWVANAARAAVQVAADREALDLLLDARLEEIADLRVGEGARLADLHAQPTALQIPLLLRALERARLRPRALRDHLPALLGLTSGQRRDLPEGLMAERRRGLLWVGPRSALPPPPTPRRITEPGAYDFGEARVELARLASLPPPEGRGAGCVDLDAAPLPWTLRPTRAEDRIQPMGSAGRKALGRRWRDAGIPAEIRGHLPVLVDREGRMIWAAGLRVDARARVGEGRPCLQIQLTLSGTIEACLWRFDARLKHPRALERP